MRRTIQLALLIALVGLAAVLFWPPGPPLLLPVYPETVTTPGTYHLDPCRSIEIKKADGHFEYWEQETAQPEDPITPEKPSIVSYGVTHLFNLQPGWRIGLTPPDTIVIETGTGSTIQRVFGEEPELEAQIEDSSLSVNRRPSEPSSAMAKIIAGNREEVTRVPIEEVESADTEAHVNEPR